MHTESHQLAVLRDRDELHRALLSSSATMAAEEDIQNILTMASELLTSASSDIDLAWTYFGPIPSTTITPNHISGNQIFLPAESELPADFTDSSLFKALSCGEAYHGAIEEATPCPYHQQAAKAGLKSYAILPFGKDVEHSRYGIIVLYSNKQDYFREMGLEPFLSFAQLGQVVLEKSNLRSHLNELATFDHLTRLLNRRALQEILESEHSASYRHKRNYSIMLLDMDHFKLINDHYGHNTGDQVLLSAANLAKEALRDCDWIGRWGGEEFLCLLPDTSSKEAIHIAERIRERIASCSSLAQNNDIQATVSIGLASYPDAGKKLDTIIACADGALYKAKRNGRNRVVISNSEYELFALAGELESAIRERRVIAAYQPIMDIKTGKTFALEALARIKNGDSIIEATDFIRAASQLQLVHQIDYVVLEQALEQGKLDHSAQPLPFFINISADLLRQQHLLNKILQRLTILRDSDKMPPIIIEVTERELLNSVSEVVTTLQPFIDLGAQLAIDDFGSGYSSFQYLADLPVDFLKIEGELINRAIEEPRVRAILQGIQDIATQLKLATIAEHIESEESLQMVREIGIDLAQGYYVGMPTIDP